MEMEKIYEGLNEIFRDVFDDDSLVVTETTTAADIEEWDSLANINIIVRCNIIGCRNKTHTQQMSSQINITGIVIFDQSYSFTRFCIF